MTAANGAVPGRSSRPRAVARLLAAAVVGGSAVLVAGAGLAVATGQDVPVLHGWAQPRAFVDVDGRAVPVPRPAPATGRMAAAVVPDGEGSHAFLHTTPDGDPVGYDPCRPVRWVVRPDGAPPHGIDLVRSALEDLAVATGLVFEEVGTTDEPPDPHRALVQPDRYGPGWAPLLVAWSDEEETPELAGPVAGIGGSAAVPGASGEGMWLAGGRVVLDAGDLAAIRARPGGEEREAGVVLHELAHALGLDHVDDVDELMHPEVSDVVGLGPGDLEGLARLGQVPCEP